ncbi:MAG: NRDE family protein [Pseudomonadota bacterium]|nr:NRDE family protein [Pseudomonadota bacterium]
MCLAVLGLGTHPRFSLVIAANRDERYARPTEPAGWWPEGWLAGRDLEAGGTWLGIDRNGRWALLTNVREARAKPAGAPSRGGLVTGVLADARDPEHVLLELAQQSRAYSGFNLLAGRGERGAWLSNREVAVRCLGPGTHGISNASLDTPWTKVVETRRGFDAWCAAEETDPEALFAALASRDGAPEETLPETGISRARERLLSSPFVITPEYGTRCSTVVLIERTGTARFEERSFDEQGRVRATVRHQFRIAE